MIRWLYIITTRLCLALVFSGVVPIFTSQPTLLAQSKKKDPAQASKYAKRGSSRAKKKDFKGALSDYKKAYQLNPTASYKKKVQQLTGLAKRQGGSNQSKSKVSKSKPLKLQNKLNEEGLEPRKKI